jgi:DNA-binding NarL/FixJ family response regulator
LIHPALDREEPPMPQRGSLDDGGPHRSVRIALADDHEATRAGLRLALRPHGFTIAAEAADAHSAIRAVAHARPDQCLIATHLPGGGIHAAAEIHACAPEVAIVMLDTAADKPTLFAALEAGAVGYLLMDIEPLALGNALRGVQRGEAALPRHLVAEVISEFRARSAAGTPPRLNGTMPYALTERQRYVLELLTEGASTAEIGRRLGISPTTVRRHLSLIVARLGVEGRAGAIEAYRAVRGASAGGRWARRDPSGV